MVIDMDVQDYLKLLDKYGTCPNCKSKELGNGEGGLTNDDKKFNRWCKCGFNITVNSNDEEIKEEI